MLKRKIIDPLVELLKQGITPEKIALSIAVGLALAVFPVLGSTTLLCAAAAVILRLNMPAIQLVNWFAYPLQILLLIPFMRVGEAIFRAPRLPLTAAEIVAMIHSGVWTAIKLLWRSSLYAITAWTLIAPLAALLIYAILLPVLRRVRYTRAG